MIGNVLGYTATACLFLALGGCVVFEGGMSSDHDRMSEKEVLREDQDVSSGQSPDTAKGSPAVIALMLESRSYKAEKSYAQAAASLERALRIEPRNPSIYAELAEVMLAQELPDEAENLARRSNSLASGDTRLQARNWYTIAAAMRFRGENAGAEAAERRAKQLGSQKP